MTQPEMEPQSPTLYYANIHAIIISKYFFKFIDKECQNTFVASKVNLEQENFGKNCINSYILHLNVFNEKVSNFDLLIFDSVKASHYKNYSKTSFL